MSKYCSSKIIGISQVGVITKQQEDITKQQGDINMQRQDINKQQQKISNQQQEINSLNVDRHHFETGTISCESSSGWRNVGNRRLVKVVTGRFLYHYTNTPKAVAWTKRSASRWIMLRADVQSVSKTQITVECSKWDEDHWDHGMVVEWIAFPQ